MRISSSLMLAMITDLSKDPLGQALLDYHSGKELLPLIAHCDIADDDEIPIAQFFRTHTQMPQLEQAALQYCRGKILDIGAGAGSHSLILQAMGLEVTAMDISPGAVAVMRGRGLKRVFHADIFNWKAAPFDTLLLMMNGIGLVGDLKGLDIFLLKAQGLIATDGQILLDSSDLSYLYAKQTGVMMVDNQAPFWGEAHFSMKYGHIRGAKFKWLYLDFSLLQAHAHEFGYDCELLFEGKQHDYLASLKLRK